MGEVYAGSFHVHGHVGVHVLAGFEIDVEIAVPQMQVRVSGGVIQADRVEGGGDVYGCSAPAGSPSLSRSLGYSG